MGMSEAPKKWVYRSSTLHADLQRKLDPRRFHWITSTMSSVIGYILGVPIGIPVIEERVVVYDGAVVARPRGSAKTTIIGQYDDLVRSWKYLLSSAGLTMLERMTAESLFAMKIGYLFENNA
jgi:hypothetical protein